MSGILDHFREPVPAGDVPFAELRAKRIRIEPGQARAIISGGHLVSPKSSANKPNLLLCIRLPCGMLIL